MEYKILALPEQRSMIAIKKRILQFCEELKIIKPTMNDPGILVKEIFEFDTDKEKELEKTIMGLARATKKFDINVKTIDTYPEWEYHYKIEPSKILKDLHFQLLDVLANKFYIEPKEVEGEYFNFTIPLIFGDLHPGDFEKASKILESYNPNMEIELDRISIFKKQIMVWGRPIAVWKKHKDFLLK